jgi:PII-like signaling protein
MHSAKLLELSSDLPLVIEIVDTEEKLAPLLTVLDGVVEEGLVTLEKVHVVMYRHSEKK